MVRQFTELRSLNSPRNILFQVLTLSLAICLMALAPKDTQAQNWEWAKPADWQTAACKVVSEGGSGGSGALVEVDGVRFVLTCRHVVDGMTGVAEFRDGTKVRGKWYSPDSTKPDGRFDMACLVFDEPPTHLVALPLAPEDPGPGTRVEIMGFGGPGRLFRPYYGKLTESDYDARQSEAHQTVNAPVVHGDSGSVCVNDKGEVIGVQNVGQGNGFAGHTSDGTGYYQTCGICPITPLRTFAARVARRIRGGPLNIPQDSCPNCPPGYAQPQPRGGSGGQLYPPQDQYPSRPGQQPPPSGQAQTPPQGDNSPGNGVPYTAPKPLPEPKSAEIDYDKLADALVAKHADKLRGPAGAPGPAGKDGANGKDGKDADPAAIAEAVSKKLPIDEIAAKAASLIDLDAIASRVVVNVPAPPKDAPRIHAILVADQSQSYWLALKNAVDSAKSQHSGLRVIPEPDMDVGLLPRLVIYRDGVVAKQYGGYANVVQGLHDFSQGGPL